MNHSLKDCPYVGLQPYSENESTYFFGREKETRLIVANLFASRLTLVYGVSGVGKSSVLRAGVINNLHSRDELLIVFFNDWQNDPINGIKEAVFEAARKVIGRSSEVQESATLVEYLTTYAIHLDRRIMFILDQFEEYFLYHSHDDMPDSFAAQFPLVITQSDLPVSVLISLREDSLARLDRFEGSIPNLFDNFLRIEHLERLSAMHAIKRPIEEHNRRYAESGREVSIDQTLVDEVIRQVKTGEVIIGEFGKGRAPSESEDDIRVETPYLQLVMRRLWQEIVRSNLYALRLGLLDQLGGAKSIVGKHLDDVMGALSRSEQDIAASIFRHLVTPSGAKIAYELYDLGEIASVDADKLEPLLEKLTGSEFRVLRPLEPTKSKKESAVAFARAHSRTLEHQTAITRMRLKKYEIFHDVLATAILDWCARYRQTQELTRERERQAQEIAREKEQRAIERKKAVILKWAWAFTAIIIGVILTILSYRYNWLGSRSIYLAGKANRMDVIAWLIEQKVGENINWGNFSAEGTKRALVALRFANELDPNNPRTKEHLENFLRDSRIFTRPENAPLELLENSMMILEEVNREIYYKPIEDEIDTLRIRIKRIIDNRIANEQLKKLQQQTQDSTFSDQNLLRGYQELFERYHLYLDMATIQNQIASIQESVKQFEHLLKIQKSDTTTVIQKLSNWNDFVSKHRRSPERIHGTNQIRDLNKLIAGFASILKEEDFVTSRNVVNRMPEGISNSFSPGTVYAWARVNAPRNEKLTIRWYVRGSLFQTNTISVSPSAGYRVYVAKIYGSEAVGMNEVRLYNSQNILIGRRRFRIL